jgi:hypothetical protein
MQATGLGHFRAFAVENQDVFDGQGGHTARPTVAVKEFDFETIGGQKLNHRAYVADLDTNIRRDIGHGNQVQQFG